jgi:hypothetical protein
MLGDKSNRFLTERGTIQYAVPVATGARANIGKVVPVEDVENVRLMIVNLGPDAFQGGRVQGTSFGEDAADAYWDDLTTGASGIVALANGAKFSEVYQSKAYRFVRVQAFAANAGTADVSWTGA